MPGREFHHLQVVLRVLQHAVKLLELKEADVAVMVLDGLHLQPRALVRLQGESLVIAVVLATSAW